MSAASIGRFVGKSFLKSKNVVLVSQLNSFSTTKTWIRRRRRLFSALAAATGGAAVLVYALDRAVKASDLELTPPKLSWYHKGIFNSLDHASVRRGYEVYKNVCSACHSLQYVAFRDLVDISHTEEEAKKEAEERTITDGPDDEGNMFERPGKLSDYFPSPYPNMEAARAANNGAYPPDLTYIIPARGGNEDYVFHLLTGYQDIPAGISLKEGQYFNPYFQGGAISMTPPLYNDVIEYEDGTPAYASQLAKDIVAFLAWTSEPGLDDRKKMFIRAIVVLTIFSAIGYYYARHKWSLLKSRKFQMLPKSVKEELEEIERKKGC